MFVVDTNVLLYAVNHDSPHNEKCRRQLDAWRRQAHPWHLTWGIVYEFLRVATHPNVFREPLALSEAWAFLEALLTSSSLGVLTATDRHAQVASEVLAELPDIQANLVFDAHTAILMREHGIKTIYTRDSDFNQFPFLDVVDPVGGVRRTTSKRRPGKRP